MVRHSAEAPPQDIAEALAIHRSRLGVFARQFLWYSEVTSTNDAVARLAESGAAEGTVVAADAQTAGRGRHGRVWVSPAAAGLYVSILLRPDSQTASLVTLAAGVAISEGIDAAAGLRTYLKWPNDVYASGRKLAGILAEAGSTTRGQHHVVLGCGINVLPGAFPPEIAARATSIETELGRPVDRGLLLAECLAGLSTQYEALRARRLTDVIDAWRKRAAPTLRRPVEWDVNGRAHRGTAENVDDTGALLVRTERGVERVIAGEVRWV